MEYIDCLKAPFFWGGGRGGYRLTQCSFGRGIISVAEAFHVEVCSIFSLAQGFHVEGSSILSDSKVFGFFFGGGGYTLNQCSFARGFISLSQRVHVQLWSTLIDSKLLFFLAGGSGTD